MEKFLNESQEQAIRHFKGPAMILAGPGSGKTRVITYRTKNLIEQYGVDPSCILVITFTKAAAMEMKQRFLAMTDRKYVTVNFGTFHAVFFGILRHAYGYSADNIMKEEQKLRFFKDEISIFIPFILLLSNGVTVSLKKSSRAERVPSNL